MCYFMWLFLFKLLYFYYGLKTHASGPNLSNRIAPTQAYTKSQHSKPTSRPLARRAFLHTRPMCPCMHTPAHAPNLTPTAVPHCLSLLASSPLTHQLNCAFTPLAKSHHSRPLPSTPTTLADNHAPYCQSIILTPYDLPSQLRPATPTCSIKIFFLIFPNKKIEGLIVK